MHSPTKTILMGAIICPLALTLTAHPAFAGGGTGDTSTPIPTTPEITTPISSNPSQPVIPLQITQQSISNWNGSALTPPSCNGGCFFAVTKATPATYGSGTNIEAMVGVTIPIGSNDGGVGEINRLNAEMQKYRSEYEMKLALSEKLADAIENGKTERAKIIAMNLAPLMGYKNYQLLLNNFVPPTAVNNNQLLGLQPTYVNVMF